MLSLLLMCNATIGVTYKGLTETAFKVCGQALEAMDKTAYGTITVFVKTGVSLGEAFKMHVKRSQQILILESAAYAADQGHARQ